MMIISRNINKLPSTRTQSHTLYPSWRPLHFLLVPIMQEQAALLPGSQAGEEGTSVWSHGAHCFPLTSTPPSLPPFFTLLSLFQSFSISLMWLIFPYFSSPLPPFTSHTGPHTFALWKIEDNYLLQEKAQTNKHTKRQDVPQIEGYFYMSLTWFDSRKHCFYIYRLCLSPGVEKGCGSCI